LIPACVATSVPMKATFATVATDRCGDEKYEEYTTQDFENQVAVRFVVTMMMIALFWSSGRRRVLLNSIFKKRAGRMPWSRLTFWRLRHLVSFMVLGMLAVLFIMIVTIMLGYSDRVAHLMQKCFGGAPEAIAIPDLFLQPPIFCLKKLLDVPFLFFILSLLVSDLAFELLDRVFDSTEFIDFTKELGEVGIFHQAFRELGDSRDFGHFLPRVSGGYSVYHWFCTLDDLSVESDVPNHLTIELIDVEYKMVEGRRASFHDASHVPGSSKVICPIVSGAGDIQ
jgi:hypothetical protein